MSADQGAEVSRRTAWSVRLVGEDLGVFGSGEYTFSAMESRSAAEHRVAFYREHRPDIEATLVSCEVEIRRGPWRPAGA